MAREQVRDEGPEYPVSRGRQGYLHQIHAGGIQLSTAGEVICKALVDGKSYQDIHELLKVSHPHSRAAQDIKSCKEQVAWYRSQMKRGLLSPSGVRLSQKGQRKPIAKVRAERRTLKPAKDILLELFGGSEKNLAGFLLGHTYFVAPPKIRARYEHTGSAAWFPDCVRTSNQHHGKKRRKDTSTWDGQNVQVHDNTKARVAFASFSGLVMAGDRDGRIRGYHVAHVWEHVYDPTCFTAGWNLCLMPGFLKLFTEQQDRIEFMHQVIQQAAFDLYFRDGAIGLPPPSFVTDPGLNLNAEFPALRLNLL